MSFAAIAKECVQAAGAIASCAIGLYVLVSDKTHDKQGALTKAGRTAFLGLIITLIVSLLAQVFDAVQRANDAKSALREHEELLRASLYSALNTKDARVNLSFWLPLADLQRVDPEYAAILSSTYEFPDKPECVVSEWPIGGQTARMMDCDEYSFEDNTLSKATLHFTSESKLSPLGDTARLANVVIANQGFGLCLAAQKSDTPMKNTVPCNDWFIIRVSQFVDTAQFTFEGDGLRTTVADSPLSNETLNALNATSLVDLLGKTLVLDPSLRFDNCAQKFPNKTLECTALNETFSSGRAFEEFTLVFPHRRRIAFERNGYDKHVISKEETNPPRTTFAYLVPDRITDLPTSARQMP